MPERAWLDLLLRDRWTKSQVLVSPDATTAPNDARGEVHDLLAADIYAPESAPETDRRLRLCSSQPISLSVMLPWLTDFGLEVLDERSEVIHPEQGSPKSIYLFNLGVRAAAASRWASVSNSVGLRRFADALGAVWSGEADSDVLNSLVLSADLGWRQVAVLRSYAAIVAQLHKSYSRDQVVSVLACRPEFGSLATSLFERRHDPALYHDEPDPGRERDADEKELHERYVDLLDTVEPLDDDRILRCILALLSATTRTNAFKQPVAAAARGHLALKLDMSSVPDASEPRPIAEVWVHGPLVEGVHMRFAKIARGGLRWSDRGEDVRTEVLGLARAQSAKNAVIVPGGAKGGFSPRRTHAREHERGCSTFGVDAYRAFVGSLLDITDNRDSNGALLPPADLVRHDGDDDYLVVAADKGTATFSDHANAIAHEADYWLGDAFASGGSNGFDHKAMGITACGAWESTKRHFIELGIDAEQDRIRVIGIGDMGGDVFGNGLLRSPHLQLVAAFDHRHIFIDPDPDPAASFRERQRLASMPRSSWADYDADTLSPGSAVIGRDAKSVTLSPQAATLLDIEASQPLTPAELVRAVLRCRADLLWNGGIGTYVKAVHETDSDVADHANDAVRINGADLRVSVAVEGGNLGFTQAGRIEAAKNGVRVSTDAIDNAAGVVTSDREVNIKLALRNLGPRSDNPTELLPALVDQVGEEVVRLHHRQVLRLSMESQAAQKNLSAHRRLTQHLLNSANLVGARTSLPTQESFEECARTGQGLTTPELAGLLLAVKIELKGLLLDSRIPDEPFFESVLGLYFPTPLHDAAAEPFQAHPLRREITATQLASEVVDYAGIGAVFSAVEELGLPAPVVIAGFATAMIIFDHREWAQTLFDLDTHIPAACQIGALREGQRLLERTARRLARAHMHGTPLQSLVARYRPAVATNVAEEPTRLVGNERRTYELSRCAFETWGLPADLAQETAHRLDTFVLLDVCDLAQEHGLSTSEVSRLYHELSNTLGIDYLLTRVSMLPREDRWDDSARAALREDLYGVARDLTGSVITRSLHESGEPVRWTGALTAWSDQYHPLVSAAQEALRAAIAHSRPGLAQLSVVVRRLRALSRAL